MSVTRWCFDRRNRLVRSSEYQHVFDAKTQQISGGGLSILACGNGLEYPRLGLIVSLRVAQSAVERNRIKRLVRESFRLQQARIKALDVVVIARSGVVKQANQELLACLEGHWKKLEQCTRFSST